jgi:hypothetical protein
MVILAWTVNKLDKDRKTKMSLGERLIFLESSLAWKMRAGENRLISILINSRSI